MVKQSIKQIHYLQYNEYKTTCEICCTLVVREIAKFGVTMEEEENRRRLNQQLSMTIITIRKSFVSEKTALE